MIGFLRGAIQHKTDAFVTLEVNGIGYEVNVPAKTCSVLPDVGALAALHTHLHVRPESQVLFGFRTLAERDMFRILININQVGPRLALSILSELSPHDLAVCVQYEDVSSLEKVPGVGKRTAARLLVELSDKIEGLSTRVDSDADTAVQPSNIAREAVDALIAMGFSRQESSRIVQSVRNQAQTTEEVVRIALSMLSTNAR